MGQHAARCAGRRESDDPDPGGDYRANPRRSNADPQPSSAHDDTNRHRPASLDPDGDCTYYSDAATNSRFHPDTFRDANSDTHADTFRDANPDTTAFADQSGIEPDTCRSSHVRANRSGSGEPHARVRNADAFPNPDADTHADARRLHIRDAHSRVDTRDLNADANCDTQSHTYPARDHNAASDHLAHRDPDANVHANPHTYTDGNTHTVSNGDGDT